MHLNKNPMRQYNSFPSDSLANRMHCAELKASPVWDSPLTPPPNPICAASIAGFAVCLIFTHEGAPEESTGFTVCGPLSAWLECVTEQSRTHSHILLPRMGRIRSPCRVERKHPTGVLCYLGCVGKMMEKNVRKTLWPNTGPAARESSCKTVALPVFLFCFAVVLVVTGFLFICFVWGNGWQT